MMVLDKKKQFYKWEIPQQCFCQNLRNQDLECCISYKFPNFSSCSQKNFPEICHSPLTLYFGFRFFINNNFPDYSCTVNYIFYLRLLPLLIYQYQIQSTVHNQFIYTQKTIPIQLVLFVSYEVKNYSQKILVFCQYLIECFVHKIMPIIITTSILTQ